jgi:hemolysin activation/secretion protein
LRAFRIDGRRNQYCIADAAGPWRVSISHRRGELLLAVAIGCFAVAPSVAADGSRSAASKDQNGQNSAVSPPKLAAPGVAGDNKKPARFEIDEYRVEGADLMPQIEVEEAVYPFLGPGRTAEDVEKARAALEKAYTTKGYQTVTVSIPEQNVANGIVVLKVSEVKVGRLRVKNSRFFDIDKIKEKAPSVAEGKVPNFNAVTKDIVALNQLPDRKVTPALRAGATPGTVDVDLNVEDKFPFHGTVELNNRQTPNTEPLRVNATVHYDNLWQRGDSASVSYQVSPENPQNVQVFSGSYLARTNIDWLNVLVYGVKSDSNVATVGSQNVVGPGEIVGGRAVITLPSRENFFHTLSVGLDYKHFGENVSQNSTLVFSTPVTYLPVVANYSATFQHEGGSTQLNAGLTFGTRGLGSSPTDFDNKRFGASENFFYIKGDVSHTHDIPLGMQVFGKVQGQIADQPLVSSEQFSMGGQDTVRGYLETEALGDLAVVGTIEVRSPNLGEWIAALPRDAPAEPKKITAINEWRLFVFGDAGRAQILKPLPEQTSVFDMASYGGGTRFKIFDYANGMVAVAMPLIGQTYTAANNPRLIFKVWGEF